MGQEAQPQEPADSRRWSPLVLSASVAGPGHLRSRIPCQDAHGWQWLADGTLVLALADGAGSARHADAGARAAVAGAVTGARYFTDAPDSRSHAALTLEGEYGVLAVLDQRARAAFQGARAAVVELAEAQGVPLRDLATTLLICLWTEAGLVVGHIGDGAAVVWLGDADGGWQTLSGPSPSEYVNETTFLIEEDWGASLRIKSLPAWVPGVVLMSDGCQRAALRRRLTPAPDNPAAAWEWEPHIPCLGPILNFAHAVRDPEQGNEELQALLASEKLAGHSDDDKTLMVLRADRWRVRG